MAREIPEGTQSLSQVSGEEWLGAGIRKWRMLVDTMVIQVVEELQMVERVIRERLRFDLAWDLTT